MTANKRLLETFQPEHYDLYLDIDRGKKTISGRTTITGYASQSQIAVNQKYLHVNSVQVAGQDVPFTTDDQAEAIDITLPQAGAVTLTIDYTAPLTDTMMGIYPSYYEVNGEKAASMTEYLPLCSSCQALSRRSALMYSVQVIPTWVLKNRIKCDSLKQQISASVEIAMGDSRWRSM